MTVIFTDFYLNVSSYKKKGSNLPFTIHLLVLCAYTVDSFHSGSFCCKITKDPKVFLKTVITLQSFLCTVHFPL